MNKKVTKMGETGAENMCEWLLRIFRPDQMRTDNAKLHQELVALDFGSKNAVKNYYLKKMKMLLFMTVAGISAALLCLFIDLGNNKGKETEKLNRPGYGEGDRLEMLEVQADGQKHEMEIIVRERRYTDQEAEELLEEAMKTLDKLILGENDSLDEVRQNLSLPASLMNNMVKISWITIPYGIVEEDGRLIGAENENGTIVELQGTLTCGTMEQIYSVCANVFPPLLSEEEQVEADIKKAVELADLTEIHEEVLELPQEAGGKKLIWNQSQSGTAGIVFAMMTMVTVCLYFQMDNEIHKKAEKRRHQLMLDYPDLMWKMTMLLGAGQSIRGTFIRIAEDYRKKESPVRWVYEEVYITCLEMKSGISEAQAYERFGKRCQLPEYIRLGTVLSQNLKKGSKGLTGMLEKEAATSLNERKNHARKIGEEAGTKLLFPMILMLSVVLAVLMIPAFMAF